MRNVIYGIFSKNLSYQLIIRKSFFFKDKYLGLTSKTISLGIKFFFEKKEFLNEI